MQLPVVAAVLWTSLAGLVAQTPPNLIAITRNLSLIRQQDHHACTMLPSCNAAGLPQAPPLPYVGGTAWDPIRSQVWVTNGVQLASYGMNGCLPYCPPVPCPTSTPNAFADGLAFVESLQQLWVLDSLGFLLQCAAGCPPAIVAQCNTGLSQPAAGIWPTGLAVDEGHGLVFYSTADFATGQSWIHVARITNPCQILQTVRVPGCTATAGFGTVTGLGVEWCRRVLYLTNGTGTQALRYSAPLTPLSFTLVDCCVWSSPLPVIDDLVGLCVRPGRETSLGVPCASGCPACPMTHVLRNDPSLGNGSFALGLDGAPAGNLAWCVLGGGACTMPGVSVPPLCGPVHLPVILGALGPAPTGGMAVCAGSVSFAVPLPANPTLCGTLLSSQCIVLCVPAGGGLGTAMSPCLSWRLSGS